MALRRVDRSARRRGSPTSRRGVARRTTALARRLAAAAGLALAVASAGCAGLLRHYDRAPDGLARTDFELRRLLGEARFDTAFHRVTADRGYAPGDDLLRDMYVGLLAHYAGRHEDAATAFEGAVDLAEDRYTKSISRGVLSLISSDYSLAYEPPPTERMLLPCYAAMDYLSAGETEAAAVEARRLGSLLEQAREHDDLPDGLAPFLRTFAGAVFEVAGETNDADVAYRNAFALVGDSTGGAPVMPPGRGAVVLVLERGFVAHRVEQNLVVPLLEDEADALSSGRDETKVGAVTGIAGRITAQALAGAAPYWEGRPDRRTFVVGRHFDRRDDTGDLAYLLRVAWPAYTGRRAPTATPVVTGDSTAESVGPSLSLDVSASVVADFHRELPVLLARTVARATAKMVLTKAVEKEASKKDEALGKLAGILGNAGAVLTERADTRSWTLLPGRIDIVRVNVPPGRYAFSMEGDRVNVQRVDGPSAPGPAGRLGVVDVVAGRTTILPARLWR